MMMNKLLTSKVKVSGTTSVGQQPNYDISANADSFLVPTIGNITAVCIFVSPLKYNGQIRNSATMLNAKCKNAFSVASRNFA